MVLDAMTLSVESYRTPSRFRSAAASSEVPSGMLLVIKAAAGDEETLEKQAAIYRMSTKDLQEAAKHYLRRHLLDPKVRGLRLLGLRENASETEIKDHKRWLLKWLHPDRNPSAWEQQLFHRVNDFKQGTEAVAFQVIERRSSSSFNKRRRRSWELAKDRRRDASPKQVIMRLVRPLLVGLVGIAALICLLLALNLYGISLMSLWPSFVNS
jgi:hypothetical protein